MHLIIAALLVPSLAFGAAEDAQPAHMQVSPDGAWQVRIESRTNASATSALAHRYQGNGKGEYRHITTAPLKNRVSPDLAYLSNNGALVTIGDRDGERQLMLAIYSSDGKLVKSWSLMFLFRSDYLACMLYKADEERDGESGVGPLYWLATSQRFSESADRLHIRDRLLGSLEVDTRSGEVKSLEGPCKLPLGEMTWELGNNPHWKPSRHLPSIFQGRSYLLKIFADTDRKWQLDQIEYASTERSAYDGLAEMLPRGARITGRGEALGLPVLYSELFEEDDNIKHVSAVSGDKTRALRLTIMWRPGKVDETAAVTAELRALMAGIRRVNLAPDDPPPPPAPE